jgi:hypothetical protein
MSAGRRSFIGAALGIGIGMAQENPLGHAVERISVDLK